MDSEHPYRPPDADLGGPPAGLASGGPGGITAGMVQTLVKTRPWILFVGIMVLLVCALMVLGGIMMLLVGGLTGFGSEFGPLGGVGIGLFYLVLALLYLVAAVHLLRFAGAIKRVGGEANADAVEQALKHQLAFWRFVGIVTIAMIVLYFLIIIVAFVAGISAAR